MHGAVGQTEWIATLGFVAGVMMIRIGLVKRMLDERRPPQPCASCGRTYHGRNCPFCAHG